MKRFRFFLVVFTTVLVCMAAPVEAQTLNKFTDNGDDHDWDTRRNWRLGVPTTAHNAWIPSGYTCNIPRNYTTAVCQIITLEGTLNLEKNSVLTLGNADNDESTISGTMTIGKLDDPQQGPATLKISGDHTITGDGGTIMLVWDSVIDDNDDEGDKLTIEDNCDVSCKIDHKPTTDCSLTVTGQGSIKVALYNDAFVVADDGTRLTLADHDKDSGCCGFWIAQGDGVLAVQAVVTGAGTWEVADLYYGGKVIIGDGGSNPGCVLATGNVLLTNGPEGQGKDWTVLIVNSNGHFCTEGSLDFRSVDRDGPADTAPRILVEADVVARFGVHNCDYIACPD